MNDFKDSPFNIMLLILLGMFILLFFIWMEFENEIKQLSIVLALFTIQTIDSIVSWGPAFKSILSVLIGDDYTEPEFINSTLENLSTITPKEMSSEHFKVYMGFFGLIIKWLMLPTCLLLMYLNWKWSRVQRAKRELDLIGLLNITKEFYPQLKPPLSMNLLNRDPDKGITRREESPLRYLVFLGAIKSYKKNLMGQVLNQELPLVLKFSSKEQETPEYRYIYDSYKKGLAPLHGCMLLDNAMVKNAFIEQLGSPFTNFIELPTHYRFLAAAFILFSLEPPPGESKSPYKKQAFDLLNDFNNDWIKNNFFDEEENLRIDFERNFNIELINSIIVEHSQAPHIQDLISRHYFITTLMVALLRIARKQGKLWPDLFRWLNYIDRPMWYALNQEGGQCAFIEAAGIRSHYLAEVKNKVLISKPFVSTGVMTVEKELEKEGWLYVE